MTRAVLWWGEVWKHPRVFRDLSGGGGLPELRRHGSMLSWRRLK
jgi:hypothetical protein